MRDYITYIIVEAIMLATTAFHWDTRRPTLSEAFIAETALRANLPTGGIKGAGTSVATVCTTQLIMAVGWTVETLMIEKKMLINIIMNNID